MKNLGIVSLILVALFGSRQSQARNFDYSLQPPDTNSNIRQVIFKDYDQVVARNIDTREQFNTLGADIWVPKEVKTNFLLVLNIAWIEDGTNSLPQKFTGSIDLGVYSSTNETSATCIGSKNWDIKFDPEATATNIVPFGVSRSRLDEKRSVYFCQFHLLVPVHPALDSRFPKDISIWMVARDLFHYQIQEKDFLIDSSQNPVDFSMESGLLKGANSTGQPPQASTLASTNAIKLEIMPSNIAPVLEISLRDGFVLINSLPPITNSVLEEANPNSYPLNWQPAIESSNIPSGWELPLKSGTMLFRARLPNTSH